MMKVKDNSNRQLVWERLKKPNVGWCEIPYRERKYTKSTSTTTTSALLNQKEWKWIFVKCFCEWGWRDWPGVWSNENWRKSNCGVWVFMDPVPCSIQPFNHSSNVQLVLLPVALLPFFSSPCALSNNMDQHAAAAICTLGWRHTASFGHQKPFDYISSQKYAFLKENDNFGSVLNVIHLWQSLIN